MNKKIIASLLLVSVALISQAQLLRFGVKGGTNVSKVAGVSFKDKFEYGYHLGGLVQIKLLKKLTLQPEIMFSQVNTTLDSNFKSLYTSIANNNYRSNISLKYLTVPLVANYNISKFASLQGGVQYGKLLSNDSTLLQNGQNAFKNGDFSALVGLQLNLGKVLLSGRYVVGLQNINDIDNRDSWKNQTVQVSVGFRF
jgi:opacity protein-like surface antigen